MSLRYWPPLAALLALLLPTSARGDPWPSSREDTIDDQLAEGDIDEEDRAVTDLGSHVHLANGRAGSWVSLVGFARQLQSGRNDVGGMVVVGLGLDRLAARPAPMFSQQSRPDVLSPPASTTAAAQASPPRRALVAPSLARACVAAALRVSGLGVDDSLIDALLTRARESAWLPETRMRAMRLVADSSRVTTLATTDGTNYYDTLGTHLVLELRLTWRFDRLVYAGDEPAFERLRLERQAARARLTERTLEVLFAWERALGEVERSPLGSDEEIQQRQHASEARATLDVLTDGWFSRRSD